MALGKITGPLSLSADEKTMVVVESRPRPDSGYTYYDTYLKTIDLTKNTLSEKLLITGTKERGYTTENFSFGPNLLKAANDYNLSGVHTIDLATGKDTTLFSYGDEGQSANQQHQWSPDGMKLLFAVGSVGNFQPAKQGIWLYDYATGKTSQLVVGHETYDANKGILHSIRLVADSFDGQGFIYEEDGDLSYFDIAGGKKTLMAAAVSAHSATFIGSATYR